MSAIQFRRYELKPGSIDEFLAWWQQIVAIRERSGFRLLFGFVLRETEEFVSAWMFDGDLSERESVYYEDDERIHLAEVARKWALRYAHDHDQPLETVVHSPGFTQATHITLAESIAPDLHCWTKRLDARRRCDGSNL